MFIVTHLPISFVCFSLISLELADVPRHMRWKGISEQVGTLQVQLEEQMIGVVKQRRFSQTNRIPLR